jgi:hypothetical protein
VERERYCLPREQSHERTKKFDVSSIAFDPKITRGAQRSGRTIDIWSWNVIRLCDLKMWSPP